MFRTTAQNRRLHARDEQIHLVGELTQQVTNSHALFLRHCHESRLGQIYLRMLLRTARLLQNQVQNLLGDNIPRALQNNP